jgi:hypothetical protein
MNITKKNLLLPGIKPVLHNYTPISLEQLQADHLMSRFDEKYVFHLSKLKMILEELRSSYKILSVNEKLMVQYENIYFDTPDLKSYHDHHNGRKTRYKIRFRRYNDSGHCFLEVKRKDNRGCTNKERLRIATFSGEMDDEQNNFLSEKTKDFPLPLTQSLSNNFFRITLVNEPLRERVTIDLLIHFRNEIHEKNLEELVIAEVKQERHYYDSAFKKLMQHERIFPINISKYCLGTLLTHPGIKYNHFKPKLITLNKICDGIA